MVKVYRIEDENGKGFYSSFMWNKIPERILEMIGNQPTLEEEGFNRSDFYEKQFGFISLEQLLDWFPLSVVNYLGGVAVYEAPEEDIIATPKQACFYKSRAVFIDKLKGEQLNAEIQKEKAEQVTPSYQKTA